MIFFFFFWATVTMQALWNWRTVAVLGHLCVALGVVPPVALPNSWAATCLDATVDCEARGDNSTDNTLALTACFAKASIENGGNGCVYVPAGSYPMQTVQLNHSNFLLAVDPGATFRLAAEAVPGTKILFEIGTTSKFPGPRVVTVSAPPLQWGWLRLDRG